MNIDAAPLRSFQNRLVPEGLAAVVHTLGVEAPVRAPSCVSDAHVRGSHRRQEDWTLAG